MRRALDDLDRHFNEEHEFEKTVLESTKSSFVKAREHVPKMQQETPKIGCPIDATEAA